MRTKLRTLAGALAAAAVVLLAGCAGEAIPVAPAPLNIPFSTTDLVTGTGTEAANGKKLTVNYTAWVYDTTKTDHKGKQFDTTAGKPPFTFTLGVGQVIPGWEQGVPGMKIGGLRQLILPPELAYGSAGVTDPATGKVIIPGNATIIFEVELLAVCEASATTCPA